MHMENTSSKFNNNNVQKSTVLLSMNSNDASMYRNKYFQYDIDEPNDGDYMVKYMILKYLDNDIYVPKNYLENLVSSSTTVPTSNILQYPMIKKSIESSTLQPKKNINDITIDVNLKGMIKTSIFDRLLQSQSKNSSKTTNFKSTKNNFLKKTPVSSGSCVFSNNGKLMVLTYRVDVQDKESGSSGGIRLKNEFENTKAQGAIEILYYNEFENKCVRIINLHTQKDISTGLELKRDSMEWFSEYFTKVLFSPDDKYLGLLSNIGNLYVYELNHYAIDNYYHYGKSHSGSGSSSSESASNTNTAKDPVLKLHISRDGNNNDEDVSMDTGESSATTSQQNTRELKVNGLFNCFDWLDNNHIVLGSLNNNNLLIVNVERGKTVFNNNKSNNKCISPVPIENIFVLNIPVTPTKIHKKLIIVSPSSIHLENFNNISYKNTPPPDDQTPVFENSNAELNNSKTTGETKTETQFQKPITAILCYDIVQPVIQYLYNVPLKPTTESLLFKPTNIFQINAVVTSVSFPTPISNNLPYCLVNTIDDEVQVWDYSIGMRVAKYYGAENYQQIRIVPTFLGENSEFVVCGSEQGKLLIWNRYNGNFIGVIETDQGITTSVLANPVYRNHFVSFHDNTAFCDWCF
ncbi:hypothetical protein ACO0QE_002275 [Hanseniaspora vineae]